MRRDVENGFPPFEVVHQRNFERRCGWIFPEDEIDLTSHGNRRRDRKFDTGAKALKKAALVKGQKNWI